MDAKPFTLQAPEAIATKYGGNKQMIAQAAQMGMVDPTAAVMAGMFIDRMRSAQQAEMAPQQTVAQQVMAPPQPQPQQPPPMPPQGGPPPMPPQGGVPQGGQPPGPPQGGLMAIGGEVPDGMFDGYASGGLVSFADGGETIPFERSVAGRVWSPIRGAWVSASEKMAEDAAGAKANRANVGRVLGNAGAHLFGGTTNPDEFTSQDFIANIAKPAVVDKADARAKAASPPAVKAAATAAAAPALSGVGTKIDKGGIGPASAPVASAKPAPKSGGGGKSSVKASVSSETKGRSGLGAPDIEAILGKSAPSKGEDVYKDTALFDKLKGQLGGDMKTPYMDAYKKDLEGTEAQMKLQKRTDMWQALAEIGANMAGSKSSTFLGAAGEAVKAAMPAVGERAKSRKAEIKDAKKALAGLEMSELQRLQQLNSAAMGVLGDVGKMRGDDASRADRRAQVEAEQRTHIWGKEIDAALAREQMALTASEGDKNRATQRATAPARYPPEWAHRFEVNLAEARRQNTNKPMGQRLSEAELARNAQDLADQQLLGRQFSPFDKAEMGGLGALSAAQQGRDSMLGRPMQRPGPSAGGPAGYSATPIR